MWEGVTQSNQFETIIQSVFHEGWTVHVHQANVIASDEKADAWAKTAWNKKTTEETATTLDNVDTQTQTMDDVIVQKINQLNKPLQNQLKKQNAEIKAFQAMTPRKSPSRKPSKTPTSNPSETPASNPRKQPKYRGKRSCKRKAKQEESAAEKEMKWQFICAAQAVTIS